MTDTTNLRDEISEYIMNHVTISPDTRFRDLDWKDTDHAAGDIITLFREEMLSRRAVEAATDAYWHDDPGVPRDYGDTENALAAALDAAGLGGGDAR